MKKKLPIGKSDFKEVICEGYYFVDKSLFIKDIIEDGSEVILIPRPRRFGKTLNMSMLKYFYEKTKEDNKNIFKELKINEFKHIMDVQGKYPVIYITFKDEKHSNWEQCKDGLQNLVKTVFGQYKYILEDDKLDKYDKKDFIRMLEGKAEYIDYVNGLKKLSELLYKYHEQKVVILIDEYDVPIESGYIYDYYDKVIEFMRIFLSGGLKDNVYLEKAILTGILRVAKESVFSGLNNLEVCSLLGYSYSENFGFLEKEVEEILKYYGIEYEMNEVRNWYNGYKFGDKTIYNPWSILNYIKNYREGFKPYWVNTSSNDLVKRLLSKGGTALKIELENLIKDEDINKVVNENVAIHEIDKDSNNVWSFLLFSGYLKVLHKELKMGRLHCKLKIPNLEVKYLYEEIILGWFNENITDEKFTLMLKSLVAADIDTFHIIFSEFVVNSLSYFDITGEESEKVYHAFVLGMLVALSEEYQIKSNGESGYGRYDVMVIPKDVTRIGIIIEFKKVSKYKNETLEKAANSALEQIKDRNYKQELLERGIKRIIQLGIAFDGKRTLILEEK